MEINIKGILRTIYFREKESTHMKTVVLTKENLKKVNLMDKEL